MPKVFGIGFHKTGSTTLDAAFQILGFHAAPVRTDLIKSLLKEDLKPTMEVAHGYEAFQDNPWPVLFKEMDQEFPDSKFILTVRDEQKWIKSIRNSFGGKSTPMREWIYGEGNGDPIGREEVYLKRFNEHNKEVRNYFEGRVGTLLEVNWEEESGWEKLCKFLEVDTPDQDFPHANKGEYKGKKKNVFRLFQK